MFKGTEPTKYIQLAYLTGILPIKKEKTQSALNNFDEFTMLSPSRLAPYIGFTEEEVKSLAEEYDQDFEEVKRWYDGYLLRDHQVYNPRAVVSVMLRGEYKSYWSETASYDTVVPLSLIHISFAEEVPADIYVMTHTTAPFIRAESIEKGLNAVISGEFDSSFAAKKLQDFLWKDGVPFNYQLNNIPRTQDLPVLYEETSRCV